MPTPEFHRRPLSSDHVGRVFLCACPADTRKCKPLVDDILALFDCIACFDGDPSGAENEEWLSILSDMQLFVVLVSKRFLSEPSRAKDTELPLAMELHIPILPILTEAVSLVEYNRVFPDIQYLDPNDNSDVALPYKQKLNRALGEVLQSSAVRAKIRNSFDLSFFLSYRKKDRRGAQKLLEKIHSRKEYQSIAIWYDEFLLPGEDFNHSIEEAMNNSSLFLMSVTPHMLEPTNYVLDVEFPAAVEKEMRILAVETQSTSQSDFSNKFQNAPPLIPIEDEEKLFSALKDIANTGDIKTENSIDNTYFLGLAYLNGIFVEVNRPLGVSLIKEAAEGGFTPALEKLVYMYRCGDGVERSYAEVTRLRRKQIALLYAAFTEKNSAENLDKYLSALLSLAEEYKNLGDYDAARETLNKTKAEADRLRGVRHLNDTGALYMRVASSRLAAVERLAGNLDEAILILKSNLPFFRFDLEESGSDFDRRGLAVLLTELANLYTEKGNPTKAEKYANEATALNEELAKGEDSSAIDRYNLAVNLFNKALSLSREGEHEEAISVILRGMETVSSAMEHRESYALYLRFLLFLGDEHQEMGNLGEAKIAYARALDICDSPATLKDIVTLKLKAQALTSLGEACITENALVRARTHLFAADALYEEILSESEDRKLYHSRAKIAYMDAQVCSMMTLFTGACHSYERCIAYMEKYIEGEHEPRDLHILALACYLLGNMNRSAPDIPRLERAFTIWSELAEGEGGEKFAPFRDEVAAILVRHMF